LALIPGLELVPLAESDLCCGAAGSYNLVQPEMADRLAARKTANIRATEARCVVAGNAGCSLQIQAALCENGDDVWVAHPVDLLDLSYRGLQPPISADRPRIETHSTGA
jgi:glycolate oxidase iron-sulfur subunit